MNGVWVVALDPDITGIENVVWTFSDEALAERVVDILRQHVGNAWQTYEPISGDVDDDLVGFMVDRLGGHIDAERVRAMLSEPLAPGLVALSDPPEGWDGSRPLQ